MQGVEEERQGALPVAAAVRSPNGQNSLAAAKSVSLAPFCAAYLSVFLCVHEGRVVPI